MNIKYCMNFFAVALALWAAPVLAAPGLSLHAPGNVARGDAFEVVVQSTSPVQDVTVHWRGKPYTVPALAERTGHVARILLAVPVDEDAKTKALPLSVLVGGKEVQKNILLFSKPRPVQKLTVDKKYVDPPAHEMERIKADREKVRVAMAAFTPRRPWQLPLYRPVPGEVSSLFGLRRVFNEQPRGVHRGLDLRGTEGTPIAALADGTVVLADNLYFSGNAVYVDHGQGVYSAYLHMSQSHVQPGQSVRRGETLGLVGATGRVTGPHLHLTLLVQGVHVDPQPFMEASR